jgi:hypothetical protein
MEQWGSQLTDFHEIWYLRIFQKRVEKIQVWLNSNKSNGYFTRRPTGTLHEDQLVLYTKTNGCFTRRSTGALHEDQRVLYTKTNGYFTRRPTGTLHEDLCVYMIIFRQILLRMRYISDKRCRGSQNSHFMFHNVLWKIVSFLSNVEKYGRARQATDAQE